MSAKSFGTIASVPTYVAAATSAGSQTRGAPAAVDRVSRRAIAVVTNCGWRRGAKTASSTTATLDGAPLYVAIARANQPKTATSKTHDMTTPAASARRSDAVRSTTAIHGTSPIHPRTSHGHAMRA